MATTVTFGGKFFKLPGAYSLLNFGNTREVEMQARIALKDSDGNYLYTKNLIQIFARA